MKKKLLTDSRYLTGAIGLTGLMILLKLGGIFPFSWWIVFLPIWLPFCIIGIFALLLMVFVAYSIITKKEPPMPQPETEPEDENQKTIFFTNEP